MFSTSNHVLLALEHVSTSSLKTILCFLLLALELSITEETKPNNVYRDQLPQQTATTEFGGLDNCRQVRSNTYDDPQILAATNGGAGVTPTYETVKLAKKESGPPVLNPVYGPTGTPTSPLSPCVPVSNGSTNPVPNPVYSETGSCARQLPDVSPLSPIYDAVGKLAPTAISDPVPLHYASTTDNHSVTVVPQPPNGSHNLNEVSLPPLYEELIVPKTVDPIGALDQDSLVRNESYGLLTRNEKKH
jgi:hypothetical protein